MKKIAVINFEEIETFKTLNAQNDNYENDEKEILDNNDLFLGKISII